jgi:hypothetical protein
MHAETRSPGRRILGNIDPLVPTGNQRADGLSGTRHPWVEKEIVEHVLIPLGFLLGTDPKGANPQDQYPRNDRSKNRPKHAFQTSNKR